MTNLTLPAGHKWVVWRPTWAPHADFVWRCSVCEQDLVAFASQDGIRLLDLDLLKECKPKGAYGEQ